LSGDQRQAYIPLIFASAFLVSSPFLLGANRTTSLGTRKFSALKVFGGSFLTVLVVLLLGLSIGDN
jgi:hypothetical protein